MEFFVPGNPTASAMFSLVWWWCVLHLQLPCLLYRLGFNLFLSLPSGKLVSVQCLPSNHLCDDQHPISELQCMENWSTQIPGSAPALYLMCLCAVGRCLFFFLSFSFCFFWSLNWNRENQNRVPSMVPDLLMPPTSPSFLLWPPRGPKNILHNSPRTCAAAASSSSSSSSPLLLSGNCWFICAERVVARKWGVWNVSWPNRTDTGFSFVQMLCLWIDIEEGINAHAHNEGDLYLASHGQVIPLGKSSSLCA